MHAPAQVNAKTRSSIEVTSTCCIPCCNFTSKHRHRVKAVDNKIAAVTAAPFSLQARTEPTSVIKAQPDKEHHIYDLKPSAGGLHTPQGFQPGGVPTVTEWLAMPPNLEGQK